MPAKKVLVTGAGGFIGSHLVEQLLNQGFAVRAFTRYTSAAEKGGNLRFLSPQHLAEIEFYAGDLRDADAVRAAMQNIACVYHLGAIIAIPYSYKHPEETFAVNLNGTLNVLQAMRQQGTARGVIVSTSEVYGSAQYTPIDEKHPLQPQSPYSASKISAEALSLSFYNSFNTPVVVVRPFNTFGPRQSARAVIPTIIAQALSQPSVTLGALHPYRDYTFATDTALGLICAGEAGEAALGKVINLGTGISNTIGHIAETILDLVAARTGHRATLAANDPQRLRPEKSEVLKLEADNRLAAQLIGWSPRWGLADGLSETIAWVAANQHLFSPGTYQI
jgi:nucleoside-diphosphate-sugar epimerase